MLMITGKMLLALAFNILFFYQGVRSEEDTISSTSLKFISKHDFRSFEGKIIRVVYFLKTDLTREQAHQLKHFYQEYERSAAVFRIYELDLCIVKCEEHNIEEYCSKKNVPESVFIFRGSQELLNIGLENMFDVNSIVSNVLQVVLLRDVPILQSEDERRQYEQQYSGSSDIIFSYQRAIGTYDHRVLMEVAYAFRDRFKFAITTDKDAAKGLPEFNNYERSALWVLLCKRASASDHRPCKAIKYTERLDLASLARFVGALDQPPIHDVADDGEFNPYDKLDLHTVYIFYDQESSQAVHTEAENLANIFLGTVGIVMVDVHRISAAKHGLPAEEKIPALSFKSRDSGKFVFMSPDDIPEAFVRNHLMPATEEMHSGRDKKRSRFRTGDSQQELMDVERQDDVVAEAVNRLKHKEISRDYLPVLTDKTFPKETASKDFLMVNFYLTFDVRSMAFLRAYSEASHTLAAESLYPLAGVDCYDWTDVCGKENITQYPTTRVYRKGQKPVEYKGMLGAEAVVNYVKVFLAGMAGPLSASAAHSFLQGQLPENMATVTRVSVLGLFNKDATKELRAFKEAFEQLQGKLLFGYMMVDDAKQIASEHGASVPSVLVYRRHDSFQPHVVYTGEMAADNIIQWLSTAVLDVFPKLTMVNFPAYFAMKQPFVVLFSKDAAQAGLYEVLGKMAAASDVPEVTFCWMDLNEVLSAKILEKYLSDTTDEALVLVNHKKGTVHQYTGTTADKESITAWVKQVLDSKIKPVSLLRKGAWKPLNPGYDFLKMMDDEAKSKRHQTLSRDQVYSGDDDDDDERGFEEYGEFEEGVIPHYDEKWGPPELSPDEMFEDEVRMDLHKHTGSLPKDLEKPTMKDKHTEL